MIRLAALIHRFEGAFLARYGERLLPSQRRALHAIQRCRTPGNLHLRVGCPACDYQARVPHSCGHRSCPHCQQHEGQRGLERQLRQQVSANDFLVTFTLPAELRPLAWRHQRVVYDALMRCAWETLRTFSRNDPQLRGMPGAVMVLHTHSRRRDYHPHVHGVMPAAAIDGEQRLWRTKGRKKTGKAGKPAGGKGKPYLFNHKALAKVFRAKLLAALSAAGLTLPARYPERWVVDCKAVGHGDKALCYLGRYLYRGVIQEKDIVACENGQVTFRFKDSKTRAWEQRTLPGEAFLWLILQHVLPKGFRRARSFGFLHPNSKRLIQVVQWLHKQDVAGALRELSPRPRMKCPCCGAEMRVLQTRLPPEPVVGASSG